MTSRRPHKKSRLGCRTCKQRRVKCDEKGPPCGPCANKSIECKYSGSQQVPKKRSPPQQLPAEPQAATTPLEWSTSQRALELELFHQWATVTYKSYCGTIEDEYHNWQTIVPKLALKHEVLLHGIFAMAALEIGAFSEGGTSHEYLMHALHYENLASSELREELSRTDLLEVPQDKHQALWAVSSILMALSLALPPYAMQNGEKYNMLDHIMTYTELSRGLVIIVHSRVKSLKEDPLLCNYKEWDELVNNPIEPDTQSAIKLLMELNEETYGASRVNNDSKTELQAMTYHAACRRAIFFLEECFAKCSTPETRAYGLAWTLVSGKDFLAALKGQEALALVILMHWGVFLEKQSYGIWYVNQVGKYLVEDLSESVSTMDKPRLRDSLNWAREQVGLDKVP